MPPSLQIIPVEAFITDMAFTDQRQTINDALADSSADVAALTPKALTYFNTPSEFIDRRNPIDRDVNWIATTSPKFVVDQVSFTNFVETINDLGSTISTGFFKIIDRLLFNYNGSTTASVIETFLAEDVDTAPIYVPNSFSISALTVQGTLFNISGTPTVTIPSFVTFTISVLSGTTVVYYKITLYASVLSFLSGYNISTISVIIPPLPYSSLYSGSLIGQNSNIFSTATITASLSYNTARALLENTTVSGMSTYNAVLVDTSLNRATVPFNVLFKGQRPTAQALREAIREAVLNSGIGNANGWRLRIPGLFVIGRYYLIPLWDKTFTKPDQVIFPSINSITDYISIGNSILESLGQGDLTVHMDALSVYFNRMTVIAVPDVTGEDPTVLLSTIIPDYQDFSPVDENFVYMSQVSQKFATDLNTFISADANNTPSIYSPTEENELSFYTFEVGGYEMCVITQENYAEIRESI